MTPAEVRAEVARADAAYTQAIQDAARNNNWYNVPAAAHAARRARMALNETKDET